LGKKLQGRLSARRRGVKRRFVTIRRKGDLIIKKKGKGGRRSRRNVLLRLIFMRKNPSIRQGGRWEERMVGRMGRHRLPEIYLPYR